MSFNAFLKNIDRIKIATLTLLLLICCICCRKNEQQETENNLMIVQSWDCGADSGTVVCKLDTNKILRVSGNGAMKDYNLRGPWYHPNESREIPECEITGVVIENGVTSIGKDAFNGCNIKSVTIPNSVISIGESAFRSSDSLKSVIIPDGVTSIGIGAFSFCSGLLSVTIPNSVTYIGYRAFNGMTSIHVEEYNPNYSSIDGVLFNEDKTELIQYPANKKDSIYTIPSGVTTIGRNAFTNSIGLKRITIPNSVTSIEDWAFACCDSLTAITIPGGVESIGEKAFWHSWRLNSISSLNPIPPQINNMAFENISTDACLYVPASNRAAYRAADVWKEFKCVKKYVPTAYTLDGKIIPYEYSGYDDYDKYYNALFGTRISRDTLIPISKDFAILYREYNERLNLWYKLHIVNLNKKDTVMVAPLYSDDNYSYGSYLWTYELCPNLRYVIVDIIDKGFVDEGEDGPTPYLHETYSCMVVNIEKAKAITEVDKSICGWEDIDWEHTDWEHIDPK